MILPDEMVDGNMNILILEDKDSNRNALKNIVISCPGVKQVFCCTNRKEAFARAMDYQIDLFLLDIILEPDQKNDNSGILFAEQIRKVDTYKLTPIIFITVLMGLERELLKKIHCYDYIEKPIGDGGMVREHIEEVLAAISMGRKTEFREAIPLHYDGIGYMVYMDEVICFENKHGVLHIHTIDDEIVIPNLSAKNLLKRIKHTKFLMPIYGTAVNVNYIEHVDFRNREVYMKVNNSIVPIGGRKYKQFKEEYMNWKSG